MADKNIIVQLAAPERKFVKVYQDFLQNELLTAEEKIVFIVLKSFVDFSKDSSGAQGEVYPTMETVCKLSSLSRPRATRTINKLIEKKIVKKIRRGLTKPNVYILSDYATMWACESVEEMAEVADNKGVKPLTPQEHIAELERMGYTVQIKEKGLDSEPAKAHYQAPDKQNSSKENDSTAAEKSQADRYTMQDIKTLYEYDSLIMQYPARRTDIDIVFEILHETLNTTKQTIRIGGEDKPQMVVISKLMKLQPDDLMYSVEKFHEQDQRIKNAKGYLLTLLYNSREQSYLDTMNKGHFNHDF